MNGNVTNIIFAFPVSNITPLAKKEEIYIEREREIDYVGQKMYHHYLRHCIKNTNAAVLNRFFLI